MIALIATVALGSEGGYPPGSFVAAIPIAWRHGVEEDTGGEPSLTSQGLGVGASAAFSLLGLAQGLRGAGLWVGDYEHVEVISGGAQWMRGRVEVGVMAVRHTDTHDLWFRATGFTGTPPGGERGDRVDSVYGGYGWRVAAGAQIGPVFVEASPVALGAEARSQQARVFVLPFRSRPYMIGLDVDRVVWRELMTNDHGTRWALCVGVM